MMTKNEQKRIVLIKRDISTRHKWSKQDYSDFYYRDVGLLLEIIDRYASQQANAADGERQEPNMDDIMSGHGP